MAETAISSRKAFERLSDALTDPVRSERTMVLLLIGYLAAWFAYAVIAKSSQDIHVDMGEMVAWSRVAGLGTPKHPPLAAWLIGAWFRVFPREDWAYYLFATMLPTIALWIGWRMSAPYLPGDKRIVGVALLTFVPFYNFLAFKYNANAVLVPLWAAATFWFLRSFEVRRAGSAALAGVGAAAAMLGKYWSVLLLTGLGLAALTDRRRSGYFSSAAPYVTLAVGTVLLAPHVDWLLSHQFMPFSYAVDVHSSTLAQAAVSAVAFVGESICYAAVPIVLSLLAARPGSAAIWDTIWPAETARRTIVVAFVSPFLFAALAAIALRVDINSLWACSMMTLLPTVLLSSPRVSLSRVAALRITGAAVAFPLLMVTLSPFVALYVHQQGAPDNAADYRLLAQKIDQTWRANTERPLSIIGGSYVPAIAFYFENSPSIFNVDEPSATPWIDDDLIHNEGIAIVCVEIDPICLRELHGFAAHFHAVADVHFAVARRYFGTDAKSANFEIAIILPQS